MGDTLYNTPHPHPHHHPSSLKLRGFRLSEVQSVPAHEAYSRLARIRTHTHREFSLPAHTHMQTNCICILCIVLNISISHTEWHVVLLQGRCRATFKYAAMRGTSKSCSWLDMEFTGIHRVLNSKIGVESMFLGKKN